MNAETKATLNGTLKGTWNLPWSKQPGILMVEPASLKDCSVHYLFRLFGG